MERKYSPAPILKYIFTSFIHTNELHRDFFGFHRVFLISLVFLLRCSLSQTRKYNGLIGNFILYSSYIFKRIQEPSSGFCFKNTQSRKIPKKSRCRILLRRVSFINKVSTGDEAFNQYMLVAWSMKKGLYLECSIPRRALLKTSQFFFAG
jgi:hypothetical protein